MSKQGPSPTALIVGRGPASAQAALDLVRAGVGVTLLSGDDWLTPGDDGPIGVPPMLEAARHPQINLLTGVSVETIQNGGPRLRVTVRQSPRYVDSGRCTACDACAEVCPVLLPGANGDAPHKAIYRGGVPTTYAIDKAGTAPCREACPIHQRAQGYVALVNAGNFQAAYHTIKRDNPFPSICGRVCNHRCEEACSRGQADAPVNIMGLKRFVADWVLEHGTKDEGTEDEKPEPTGKRVAVVGAGPAGLTCALGLVRQGHAVTVYEALPVAGGMMRVGVPEYRLPPEVVQGEIDDILAQGVELVLNHRVEDVPGLLESGPPEPSSRAQAERRAEGGFDAVFVALGAHDGLKLPIPGADLPGVHIATDFLRAVNLRKEGTEALDAAALVNGKRVLVLGGGNVAVDAAGNAVRLGASWVGMTCLEGREQMPAHEWEIQDAEEEGVEVFPARTFKEIVSRDDSPRSGAQGDGRVAGVRCAEINFRGFKDGRPDFDELPGTEAVLEADVVIFAIGQRPQIECLQDAVETIRGRFPAVEPETLATSQAGIFAGGDVLTGAGFIVDAIAAGHKAARSIDCYLRGQELAVDATRLPAVELDKAEVRRRLVLGQATATGRAEVKKWPAAERRQDFREVYAGLTEAEARAEAARCLSCGACSECLQCVDACPPGAISHEQSPQTWEFLTSTVILADGNAPSPAGLPGVFAAQDGDLTGAVQQTLAHLGLTLPIPAIGVAAPSYWQLASLPPPLWGLETSSTQHAPRTSPSAPLRGLATRLGVFLCRCGGEIERSVDLEAVAARVEGLPGVTYVGQVEFACHPEGTQAIRSALAAPGEPGLDSAILAACSCCALDQICYSCTTQRTRCKERLGVWDGLKGLPLQFVNVREQCAFVHRDDPAAATLKAGDLVAASVAALSVASGQWSVVGSQWLNTGYRMPSAEGRMATTASVNLTRCRGCEDCELICGLEAVQVVGSNGARIAQVDATRCLGCGVCIAVCSSGAILASDTSDAQAEAMLAAMGDLSDKTVVFSCNWGAYSAVEAAGVERLAYDPSVRLLRLMCAGRAHEGLIMRAFTQGAERVLVLACGHEDDTSLCHYRSGNDQAKRAVQEAQQLLGLLGIDPARLALIEVRPGDGARFVAAVEECVKTPEGQV